MTKAFLPFLTGSRAYGKPKKSSDVDMVIRTDDVHLVNQLKRINEMDVRVTQHGFPVKVGPLNILVCTTDEAYLAWEEGTEKLQKFKRKEKKPIERDRAIAVFTAYRKQYGVELDY